VLQLAAQRTQWLSSRDELIAANIANANTPGFQATDLQPFSAILDSAQVSMVSTNPAHMTPGGDQFAEARVVESRRAGDDAFRQFGRRRKRDDEARRRQPRLHDGDQHQARHPPNDHVGFEVSDDV
jgi:hypothetical protein